MNLRHTIWPSEENDYAPHLLQKTAFIMMGGLIILSFAMVNLQSLIWLSSSWLVGTVLPAVVIKETNEERATLNALPLTRNERLDEAARLKAEDMAKNGYFAHYSPAGVSPWYWLERVSYTYAHAGENLAVHFTDSSEVVEAWMKSPAHRANIINHHYTEIGVGTAKGRYQGHETVFVVQLFGTPASAWQPLAIVDTTDVSESWSFVTEAGPRSLEKLVVVDEVVLGESNDLPVLVLSQEEGDVISNESVRLLAAASEEVVASEYVSTDENEIDEIPIAIKSESFVATSTALAAEPSLTNFNQDPDFAVTSVSSLATKPNSILHFIYLFMGSIITALLLISIGFGVRYHRPRSIAYGVMLLLLLSSLFVLHVHLTTTVVIAAEGPTGYYRL